MAKINVSRNTNVKLNDDEIDVLKKAYSVLQEVQNTLCQNDADDTETFTNVLCAGDYIYMFMKNDVGVNIDEKRF